MPLYAYHSGDRAVADRGYLTLNPLKYTHPVLSIVTAAAVPAARRHRTAWRGGLGRSARDPRPAERQPDQRSRPGRQPGLPAAADRPVRGRRRRTGEHEVFWSAVAFLAFLQLTAVVLNLMPIPGVDGGNAVRPWLSPQCRRGSSIRLRRSGC